MFGKKPMQMGANAKKSKLSALKEAHKMASDMMKDDLHGLKKVTVASGSAKGVKEGLKAAEAIVGGSKEDDSKAYHSEHNKNSAFADPGNMDDSQEHEDSESGSEETAEHEMGGSEFGQEDIEACDTPESIDDMIKQLMEKKKSLQA